MKYIFYSFLMFSCISAKAQDSTKVESLDAYFGGIPIQQGFGKWIEYITSHPDLDIDSSGPRGFYSSIKSGMSHFPFADHITVRIRISEEVVEGAGKYVTKELILVQADFGDTRKSKKEATKSFQQIKKQLLPLYANWNYTTPEEITFYKIKEKNFPAFKMSIGYEPKQQGYYYIRFEYEVTRE